MRAEVAASLCSPHDCPVKVEIDPGDIDARLSGTPSVTASPVALGLPTITATVPNITITPPTLTLSLTIGFATDALPKYLTDMIAVLNTLDVVGAPLTDGVVFAEIVAVLLLPGGLKALAMPEVKVSASLTPVRSL